MNPLRKSLSLRLLGIFILIALVTIYLLTQLFSRGLGSQWQNNIQPHLIQYLGYIHNDVGNPPDHDRALALSQRLPVNIYIYKQSNLEYSTNNKSLDFSAINFRQTPSHRFRDTHGKKADEQRERKSTRKFFTLPPDHAFGRDNRVSFLRVIQDEHTLYYELRRNVGKGRYGDHFIWALLGLASMLLFSYFIIKRQLSPIHSIKSGVSQMSQGDLEHRIAVKGDDDLAQLGHSINDMANRIENMLDAKSELLIAVSHELRSPLARSRIATEMLPDSTNKQRIAEDLEEMENLIHEIMESERLQHHTDLHYQTINLAKVVEEVVENNAEVIALSIEESNLEADLDEARLRIMLRNLVNNALQHGEATPTNKIRVTLSKLDTVAVIQVADSGPGIAAEHIEKITEPFYRPDESRTRSTGGFGMGLNLAKRIAQAHGGSMNITSQVTAPSGTCVEIRLPINRM